MIFGPIKGETFEKARRRLRFAWTFHHCVIVPIVVFGIAWVILDFGPANKADLINEWFGTVWLLMAIYMVWFVWRTRDLAYLMMTLSTPIMLRAILGSRAKEPFEDHAGELPDYLRCDDCGTGRIYIKRFLIGFRNPCETYSKQDKNPITKTSVSEDADWGQDYRELKQHLKQWGLVVQIVIPFVGMIVFFFGGAFLGSVFGGTTGFFIGAFIGGAISVGIHFYALHRLIGFSTYSTLKCPKCKASVARRTGWGYRVDDQCRKCGHPHAKAAGLEDKAM